MRAARSLLSLLALSCLLLPASLLARFSETLTPAERTASGMARLSDDEVGAVDALVQRELTLARQGRTNGFAKSFTQRRTDSELKATGIPQLDAKERAELDTLVAAQLAKQVLPANRVGAGSTAANSVALPKPRQGLEVHGSVSLFAGANSNGGSFYGGYMETTLMNRSGTFALTLGYGESHGRGMGLYPYGYGYGYDTWPWYDSYYGYAPCYGFYDPFYSPLAGPYSRSYYNSLGGGYDVTPQVEPRTPTVQIEVRTERNSMDFDSKRRQEISASASHSWGNSNSQGGGRRGQR